jgi:DNA-binding NtrC family response regulator
MAAEGVSRVLVIDDEPLMLEALRRLLKRHHQVELTTSPTQALERLSKRTSHYDAVLCDLTMGELSGMELYAEVARVNPDQARRMLFLTGGAATPAGRRFTAEHAGRCLTKPFDSDNLLRAVQHVVEQE